MRRAHSSTARAKGSWTCRWPGRAGSPAGCLRSSCPSPRNKPAAPTGDTAPALDTAAGAPLPPPLDLTTAQAAVSSMASILFRIEREADGRVRICRTVEDIRALHRDRRAGRRSAYRRRGGDRSGVRNPRCAASGRAALARPGVEPAERVRTRRAVSLPVVARHRTGPDRSRQGAGARLQPAENPDRPLASQRKRLLGRRRAQRCAAGRHPFQRPCLEPALAQSHRRSVEGDPRNPRHGRGELRGELPARGRPPGQRHAGRDHRRSRRAHDEAGRRGPCRPRVGFRRRDDPERASAMPRDCRRWSRRCGRAVTASR